MNFHHPATLLNFEQFDDVFSNELNNTRPLFDMLVENGKADIYQAIIGMTVFSAGHFDHKIKAMFAIFDLDETGEMNRSELSTFIKSGIFGLCKLCEMPRPSFSGI